MLYFNARSLLSKIDELRALTLVHKPHLICMVESWLDEQNLNSEVCIDDYDIVKYDRNRQGGGVLYFVVRSFSYDVLFSGPSELELIILSINSLISPVTVGCFYRPSAPVCISDTLLNYLLPVFLILYLIVYVRTLMYLFCLILFWWEILMSTLTVLRYLNSRVLLPVYISPKLFLNQLTSHPPLCHLLIWFICWLPQNSSVVLPSLHWPILIIVASVFLLLKVL